MESAAFLRKPCAWRTLGRMRLGGILSACVNGCLAVRMIHFANRPMNERIGVDNCLHSLDQHQSHLRCDAFRSGDRPQALWWRLPRGRTVRPGNFRRRRGVPETPCTENSSAMKTRDNIFPGSIFGNAPIHFSSKIYRWTGKPRIWMDSHIQPAHPIGFMGNIP